MRKIRIFTNDIHDAVETVRRQNCDLYCRLTAPQVFGAALDWEIINYQSLIISELTLASARCEIVIRGMTKENVKAFNVPSVSIIAIADTSVESVPPLWVVVEMNTYNKRVDTEYSSIKSYAGM